MSRIRTGCFLLQFPVLYNGKWQGLQGGTVVFVDLFFGNWSKDLDNFHETLWHSGIAFQSPAPSARGQNGSNQHAKAFALEVVSSRPGLKPSKRVLLKLHPGLTKNMRMIYHLLKFEH